MGARAFIDIDALSAPLAVVGAHSPVSRLAVRPAVSVTGSCALADAVATMRRAAVSALLVTDPLGLVTERDLARAFADELELTDPVEAIMSAPPLIVPGDTTVVAAAAMMLNEQVRHLVVDANPAPRAMVSMRDLLAVLLQAADPQLWLTSLRLAIDSPAEVWLG